MPQSINIQCKKRTETNAQKNYTFQHVSHINTNKIPSNEQICALSYFAVTVISRIGTIYRNDMLFSTTQKNVCCGLTINTINETNTVTHTLTQMYTMALTL